MAEDDQARIMSSPSSGAGATWGRKPNTEVNERIIALRKSGHSIARTAKLAGCSPTQVKRVWAATKKSAEA